MMLQKRNTKTRKTSQALPMPRPTRLLPNAKKAATNKRKSLLKTTRKTNRWKQPTRRKMTR